MLCSAVPSREVAVLLGIEGISVSESVIDCESVSESEIEIESVIDCESVSESVCLCLPFTLRLAC